MIDLAIIGGGPAGYIAAERAATKGLSVTLFEKTELGGVCLNEGCIPTKTLLYSAKVYDTAKHSAPYGIKTEGVTADLAKMMDRKNRVVRRLVGGVNMAMRESGVTVTKGAAMIKGREGEVFVIECNGESFTARNLLVCTGSETFVPPIPGIAEAGDKVLTNKEILLIKEQPASLVVIGGGVIGVEFASLFNSLGSEVTVIEMMPGILNGMDAQQAEALKDIYAKRGVKFIMQSRVTRIDGNKVFFAGPDGAEGMVEGEKVLISVGRKPVTSGFGLETLGVEMVKGGIKTDERMRTNVPGLYAAGDVTGFSLYAHTASREAVVAVETIAGGDDRMRYDMIPGVVYTNPEIAGAGITEEAARDKGIEYNVAVLPMAFSGRFVSENEGVNGSCKVMTDKASGRIIGVHMLGNPASEIIHSACLAIERGLTVQDLEKVVFPHPTVSEIFRDTAFRLW